MIIQGDCLEVMKDMESNSIDTLITDPPAGISFMGLSFDSDRGGRDKWIEWLTEIMRECYRVLKPGAHGFVWALPRTSHWTATALENAGFQIKDIIMHIFGSGFPKSLNISKAMDKKAGKEREIIGRNPNSRENCDKENTLYESGTVGKTDYLTEPATEEAKQWEGYGTALKPSAEHWIMIMKPNDGTYVNNALKHGVSGLNIDECRIEVEHEDRSAGNRTATFGNQNTISGGDGSGGYIPNTKGRFPANIILDEETGKMLDEQSGYKCGAVAPVTGKEPSASKKNAIYNDYSMVEGKAGPLRDGLAGASRFYYCAKSSKSEKNAGCENFPIREKDDRTDTAKGSMTEKGLQPSRNHHPCCKPLKLMEYLCRLTKTPTGGVVLDCFAGSFTTACACINIGRDYIMIEQDKDYCEIGRARVKHYEKKNSQINIFEEVIE